MDKQTMTQIVAPHILYYTPSFLRCNRNYVIGYIDAAIRYPRNPNYNQIASYQQGYDERQKQGYDNWEEYCDNY